MDLIARYCDGDKLALDRKLEAQGFPLYSPPVKTLCEWYALHLTDAAERAAVAELADSLGRAV